MKVLQQNSQYNYFVLRFPILLLDLLLSNGSNLQQKKNLKKIKEARSYTLHAYTRGAIWISKIIFDTLQTVRES